MFWLVNSIIITKVDVSSLPVYIWDCGDWRGFWMSPIQICALSPTWKLFLTDLIYKSFDFPLQLVLCDSVSLVLLYKVKDTLFQCLSVGKIIYLIIVIGYSSYTITITLYYCCFYVLIFKMSKLKKKKEKKKERKSIC